MPNFDNVQHLIDQAMENYSIPCADIVVTQNGKEVYRYWNGTKDDEQKIALEGDELYFLYSAVTIQDAPYQKMISGLPDSPLRIAS